MDDAPTHPRPGTYRHAKGGLYEVLAVATHSEDGDELVVYRSLADGRLWARPLEMFTGTTEREGRVVPRFSRLS